MSISPNDLTNLLGCASAEEIFLESFRSAYKPEPIETVSEWADKYRILSTKESEPGPYRTSRTPYLREIMDSLSACSPVTKVVVMKGAQLGMTDAGNNWIGYVIHRAPGRMLAVMPRLDDAKKNSKSRIATMIDSSPVLKGLVQNPRSRDSGNTILMKEFRGGELIMTGSNSAAGLRSTPARYLFLDEVDAYPGDVEEEGDPVQLAIARTRTFPRKKIFIPSTPTVQGYSRIENEFELTDKRYYFVPCPHCEERQILRFRRPDGSFGLRWQTEEKKKAVFYCEHCGGEIGDEHKTEMLKNGEWRPTAECNDSTVRGYHLSSLYSPVGLGDSWTEIMKTWEEAQTHVDKLKSFVNTVLGESWVDRGDAPEWRRLYERREVYPIGKIPSGGLLLTAGFDVQKDRIEGSIWAWGRGKESWLVEHRVIDGDTSRPEVWNRLDEILGETWDTESGATLGLMALAIDTGYAASEVYTWVRKNQDTRVMAIKGRDNHATMLGVASSIDVTIGGKRIKNGIRLWPVGVSLIKQETYSWLRLENPTESERIVAGYPPGFVHFPQVDEEYFLQLTAEVLVRKKNKRGFPTQEWNKTRERNEALDCRVYARAAAIRVGLDRFSESSWKLLEQQVKGNSKVENPETSSAPTIRTENRPARRVVGRMLR